jgi:hypothetical protein
MGITIQDSGSFKHMESFLRSMQKLDVMGVLHIMGDQGVKALAAATPRESGLAANSWGYEASKKGGVYSLTWTNSDNENGFPVVIALQYGYATGTGGYVHGRDYINPAIRGIFDKIAEEVWKAVTSA